LEFFLIQKNSKKIRGKFFFSIFYSGWLNDIALIKLKQPITSLNSANGARQICLPKRSLNDLNREFSATNRSVTCFLAGWGYTSEGAGINVLSQNLGSGSSLAEAASGTAGASQIGAGSDQLLYGKLNFIPLDTCQQNYRVGGISLQGAPQFVRDNMVCASNEQKGQGACLGDSGGGLYCKEVDGTWGIYGISSWR
jgi:secreted trypsin-like serine protease